jgi:AraC-like DNA-binding protein
MDRTTDMGAPGAHADPQGNSGDTLALTAKDLMRLDYLPTPPELQPYVTVFYLFRCDEPRIRDIQPAATGQLQIYLSGKGRMFYPHGRTDCSFPETLQAPQSAAAPFEVDGPFHLFGAALSPLGWAALTGMAADKAIDRLHDARTVLGTEIAGVAAAVRDAFAADPAMDGTALVAPVAEFIGARLRPIPPPHAALLGLVAEWMSSGFNPPVGDLHARAGYSPRQVQRLFARYFGFSPAHLVRLYRATRISALLAEPGITPEREAELTNEFYDQSHMIREIREFTGRTPARLLAEDDTILRTLLDVRNFRQIKPNVAPLPPLENEPDGA